MSTTTETPVKAPAAPKAKRITKKAARAEIARRKLPATDPARKAFPAKAVFELKNWQLREIVSTPVRSRKVTASA
jgi:hypothetical protein